MPDIKKNKNIIDAREACRLLRIRKVADNDVIHALTERSFTIGLHSEDGQDSFQLDYSHGSIALRYKIQCRVMSKYPLLRLDVGGPFHNNPNVVIECMPDDPFYTIHNSCIGRALLKSSISEPFSLPFF